MKLTRRGLLSGLLGLPVVGILGQEALAKREPLVALKQVPLPKTPIVVPFAVEREWTNTGFVATFTTTAWTLYDVTKVHRG